jgi:hypothetical protein
MTDVLIKRGKFRHRHTGKHHVVMETRIGVAQLQAKEAKDWWPAQEAKERRREQIPLGVSQRSQRCWCFNFGLLAFRTVKEQISVVICHRVYGKLLQ